MELEPVDGDPGSIRATLEWHGEAERVAVVGGPAGWTVAENLMERDGDGAWRRSYVVSRALRTVYGFLPDPPDELEWGPELWYAIRSDPLNPAAYVFPGDAEHPARRRARGAAPQRAARQRAACLALHAAGARPGRRAVPVAARLRRLRVH